jgi:hypothetical protein
MQEDLVMLIAQAVEKAIQPLQEHISRLESRLSMMKKLEEVYHGPVPQPEDIPLMREVLAKKKET